MAGGRRSGFAMGPLEHCHCFRGIHGAKKKAGSWCASTDAKMSTSRSWPIVVAYQLFTTLKNCHLDLNCDPQPSVQIVRWWLTDVPLSFYFSFRFRKLKEENQRQLTRCRNLVPTTEPSAPAKKFCRKSLFPAFLFHLRMNLLLEINYKWGRSLNFYFF